jgi:hypothetical protein
MFNSDKVTVTSAREESLEEILRRVNDLHVAYANRPREMYNGLTTFINQHISPILLHVRARDKHDLYQAYKRIAYLNKRLEQLTGENKK